MTGTLRATRLTAQLSRAPILSHCRVWEPAGVLVTSSSAPVPKAPLLVTREVCPAWDVTPEAVLVVKNPTTLSKSVTEVTDPEAGVLVPLLPLLASRGEGWSAFQ